jgi:hypothetical protein
VRDPFIRLAGVAGLLTQVLGIVINVLLLAPPPDPPGGLDTPIREVAAYVIEKGDRLALGHGLRYVAQILLLVFGAGLYCLVNSQRDGRHEGWAIVGLLATVWIPAVGIAAQSAEGVAVWQADTLAQQPQLALALWGISNVLWNATLVPFCALMLGFSLAGRASGVFPLWLVGLGSPPRAGPYRCLLDGRNSKARVERADRRLLHPGVAMGDHHKHSDGPEDTLLALSRTAGACAVLYTTALLAALFVEY